MKTIGKDLFVGILLLLMIPAYSQNYRETVTGIKTNLQSMDVEVRFYSPSIVRILKSPEKSAFIKKSLSVINEPERITFRTEQSGDAVSLKSEALTVTLNLTTGKVSYSDPAGKHLFSEKDHGTEFSKIDDAGSAAYRVRQGFLLDKNEAIYGLGQHQDGKMNQRNQIVHLEQKNTIICIPFIQSVKGYGVFWDNYSPTTFTDNPQGMSFESEIADCSDYYFMYGTTIDGTIACMRRLTGDVPLFPLWTWGYWQSRERYTSQDELTGAVKKYRDLKVPLDGIIQDWQYWSTDNAYWNGMSFGNPEFPQPQKMVNDIHAMNAHTIFSIWPSFGQRTEPYKELQEKGLLLDAGTFPSDSTRAYNPYKQEGRDIYWKYMNKNLFSIGIDGWWMDATETEISPQRRDGKGLQTGLGSYRRVMNAYPLMTVSGVYENQRKVSSDKRVFILTRSAFTGQQRYGASSWSGDVDGDWESFRKQIPAGLNFSACAIPYWNSDIGGFYVRNGGRSTHADYRELYVRWLQFGTFCSMMRSHGTNTPREIWQFGQKGDWAYDVIEKFIRLRYRLLPYNYSLSWDVTSKAGSVMRLLSMDFPHDDNVHDMGNQYMYGKSILVAPVTTPFYSLGKKKESKVDFSRIQKMSIYLPNGSDWYDFWTDEKLSGGKSIERETPIDIIPLYIKAGSIIPLGQTVQYAEEKDWSDLEIRVYDGTDATFTLYEDENDNYNYEKGIYSTILFSWDSAARTLTINEREGAFPGMLKSRKFKVVDIQSGKVRTIPYKGKKTIVKL
jgi:alpha-D-xyloside xylohydrolase